MSELSGCTPVCFNLVQDSQGGAYLLCPFCGDEHNHLNGVEVRGRFNAMDGVGTRVDASGIKIFNTPFGTDAEVDLEFWCECGCRYVYNFRFHEGTLVVTQRGALREN